MIAAQLVINGLIAGSLYALVAAGFSLIYATNRFVHFAHGTTITVSAYLLYTLANLVGLNFYLAALLTIAASPVIGLLMHSAIYQPLRQRGSSGAVLLIASLGLMILLENLMLLIFGADVKTINLLSIQPGIPLGSATVTPLQLVIIAVAIMLLVAIWLFTKRTKTGQIMRAVADNPELANISGISSNQVYRLSFMIGSFIAGIAAVLISLEQNIKPLMGTPLIIKGFTGAVIGGVTSVPGAALGAYLVGLIENIGIWWLPSGWKEGIAFGLLFIFLLWRPTGLLGLSKGARE